ncbi:MAG: hypothetical protein OXG24_11685 [Gammaproteobacteria bacterium]|nr:hypothetical protein [Gammaproteobacteria bacterium]
MKSRSLFLGIVGGLSGGIVLTLIGLLLYTSITTSDSHIPDGTVSSAGTATDQLPLDFSNLGDISDTTTLVGQCLELALFFETATFDQILELFDQTVSSSGSFHTRYIQEFLVKQLASMDPQATLAAIQSSRPTRHLNLIATLYSSWATQDPAEAIKSAARQARHMQPAVIRAIVSTLPIPLSSDILQLADSLEISGLVDEALAEVAAKQLMRSSPQAAFESIFSDNVDDVRQESLLSETIGTWMSEDDDEALTLLLNGFRDEYAKIGLYDAPANRLFLNLLNQIVQKDPHEFWQLNLDNPSNLRDSLNDHILRVWASLDPQAAMEAISEIKGFEIFEESFRTVWRTWAEVQPTGALQAVRQVPQELRATVIAYAVRSLARTERVEQALSSIIQMKELGENVGLAVRWLTNTWIEYDVSAATDWLLATDSVNDTLRNSVLREVLPALALSDPLRAYRLAVEYGKPEAFDQRLTLENRVIESLAQTGDFERATALLQEVDESLLVTARSTIGLSLVSFGKIDEAIALGSELAPSDQPQYFQNLAILWFQLRPDELFENLAELPTVESQQSVATTLLQDWLEYRAEMSQDEISLLENLVSETKSQ